MSADAFDKALVEDANRRARRMIDDGVEGIGGMLVAAGLCVMDRADLRKAIDHNGRRLSLEHAQALAQRIGKVNASLATRIGAAFVEPLGLGVFPLVTLTDKERADRLERMLRGMPLGEELVRKALETP